MGGFDRRICRRGAGITLPELLVVLAIIGLAVAVAVPLIADAVRSAKLRTAVDDLTVSLMAARMLAVTLREPVEMTVAVAPGNYYEYPKRSGQLERRDMPDGVRIVSANNPITFQPNGMVQDGACTTIEARTRNNSVEQWKINTSVLGVTSVERGSCP